MPRALYAVILLAGFAGAQSAPSALNDSRIANPAVSQDAPNAHRGKVSLVRGVLMRVDPIYERLIIRTFGGGDIRIAFDGQTKFVSQNSAARLTSIPPGSVVSVDTVVENGKLFAKSVRTGPSSNSAELNGQVVDYDPGKSQLTLRDPLSSRDIPLRIASGVTVMNRGKQISAQALAPGMLVRVSLSAPQNVASKIEILAERGNSYVFAGRILSVDLRSHVLALSNDTDQSLRELSFGALDDKSLELLHEGADVTIQAEFDGDRYNVRMVTAVSRNP